MDTGDLEGGAADLAEARRGVSSFVMISGGVVSHCVDDSLNCRCPRNDHTYFVLTDKDLLWLLARISVFVATCVSVVV